VTSEAAELGGGGPGWRLRYPGFQKHLPDLPRRRKRRRGGDGSLWAPLVGRTGDVRTRRAGSLAAKRKARPPFAGRRRRGGDIGRLRAPSGGRASTGRAISPTQPPDLFQAAAHPSFALDTMSQTKAASRRWRATEGLASISRVRRPGFEAERVSNLVSNSRAAGERGGADTNEETASRFGSALRKRAPGRGHLARAASVFKKAGGPLGRGIAGEAGRRRGTVSPQRTDRVVDIINYYKTYKTSSRGGGGGVMGAFLVRGRAGATKTGRGIRGASTGVKTKAEMGRRPTAAKTAPRRPTPTTRGWRRQAR